MNGRARFAFVAAGVISLLWGCENQPENPSLRVIPFEEAFELEREIELEQPLDSPIALISGLDQDGEGRIVITDQTEAAVSLFDKDGSLVWRVGRRGEGPGEFRTPIKPRFDSQGRIHVPDRSFIRITVLSRNGDHLRDVSIEKPLTILDFDLMPNGDYLIGGFLLMGGDEVVFQIDSTGSLVGQHLPLANARPAGEPESPAWRYARIPFVGVGTDRIYGALSLLDSLWSFSESSGEVSAIAITPSGYEAPVAPEGQSEGSAGLSSWNEHILRVASLRVAEDFIVLPFARGAYFLGGPSIAAFQDHTGKWSTLLGVPPILGSSDQALICLLKPMGEEVILGVYHPRD